MLTLTFCVIIAVPKLENKKIQARVLARSPSSRRSPQVRTVARRRACFTLASDTPLALSVGRTLTPQTQVPRTALQPSRKKLFPSRPATGNAQPPPQWLKNFRPVSRSTAARPTTHQVPPWALRVAPRASAFNTFWTP